MSAIADFRLIEISKLNDLKRSVNPKKGLFGGVKDNYFLFLDKNSRKLNTYKWSGFVYATLFVYLQEKGIDLMESNYNDLAEYITNPRGFTSFIFSNIHRQKYLEELNPINFDEHELRLYYNEFNESDEDDTGQAMLDGIKVLYDNIQYITPDKVLVFGIY